MIRKQLTTKGNVLGRIYLFILSFGRKKMENEEAERKGRIPLGERQDGLRKRGEKREEMEHGVGYNKARKYGCNYILVNLLPKWEWNSYFYFWIHTYSIFSKQFIFSLLN